MANDLKTYNFDNVVASINGVLMSGFWEGDDVVIIEPNAPLSNSISGAGGEVLTSISTDKRAKITLKLQPTSPAHDYLISLLIQYEAGNPQLFSFACNDIGNGEGGSAPECVLMDRPVQAFGAQASAREWTFVAGHWTSNQTQYNGQ